MARKRPLFFGTVHPLLSGRRGWRWLGIALLGGAIALLIASLSIVPTVQAQTPPTVQVERGQQQFESGAYADAVSSLEAAIAAFAAQQQPLQQAITLSNLALVYQALGQWDNAETALERGFALLGAASDTLVTELPPVSEAARRPFAALLTVYGKGRLQRGDAATALAAWRQVSRVYGEAGDRAGQISSQINQLPALQALGLLHQAQALGDQIRVAIEAQSDPVIRSKGLLNLGNIERGIGLLGDSESTLAAAWEAAEATHESSLLSAIALGLGTTQQAFGNRETERFTAINRQGVLPWVCTQQTIPASALPHYQAALGYYTQAIDHSPQLAARLNRLMVWPGLNQFDQALADWQWVKRYLPGMVASRSQIFAQIALARQGACLNQAIATTPIPWDDIRALLATAVTTAQSLNDPVAESYARGNLGGLYEYFAMLDRQAQSKAQSKTTAGSAQVWRDAAQTLTEQALLLAQPLALPDISYRWQWQLGRLQRANGDEARAIAHYQQAAVILQSVRSNLLTIDSDVQFSFRDNVEPVYRELADLLLSADQPDQAALQEVIGLIDNIQLAELENFLQCDLTGTIQLTQADIPNTSAVLYTIILADRLEVIAQLPGQAPLQHHRVRKTYTEVETTLSRLRQELEEEFITDEGEALAAEVYTWLLQPQEVILDSHPIDTLVFVLDGALRNVPPAALIDAQGQYLVEKYAIALTPRLQLQTPQPLQPSALDVLFFGLAAINDPFRQRFGPLPFVNAEAEKVRAAIASRIFLDGEFTQAALDTALQAKPAKIIHFATHGEFSSDPEKTFILAWDQPINSQELNALLRNTPANFSLELLVLSACKTATGDNRATLGLAGLALQAGAQSTVASLWTVNDEATADFIGAFYQALTNRDRPTSRAEALRLAQLTLLQKYKVPGRWAPFVLVGNWL